MGTSNYWPKRSSPNGFSIQQLAKSYRNKISNIAFQSSKDDSPEPKTFSIPVTNIKLDPETNQGHWANRDFNEYH